MGPRSDGKDVYGLRNSHGAGGFFVGSPIECRFDPGSYTPGSVETGYTSRARRNDVSDDH